MTQQVSAIKAVLKRDRGVVFAGVLLVAALAWAYTVYLARDMDNMGTAMSMPMTESWGAVDFGLILLMWVVMMVAMMVPTAAPMVLVFASVSRKRREEQRPYVPTAVFLLGYVLVWGGFAAAATLAQWGLHTASLLSSMMGESTSSILGGSLLLAAGLFQWSPLKTVCLTHCRSPLGFLMSEWREGSRGALTMGAPLGYSASDAAGC